jgi:hypothetical protein
MGEAMTTTPPLFSESASAAPATTVPSQPVFCPRRINPFRLFVGSMIPNWLQCRPEVSQGAKLAYARLAQYAGKDGGCLPETKNARRRTWRQRTHSQRIRAPAGRVPADRKGSARTWFFQSLLFPRPPMDARRPAGYLNLCWSRAAGIFRPGSAECFRSGTAGNLRSYE